MHEFADDSEATDPFAETAKSRQVSARQSDYHQRRFERHAGTSSDAFGAEEGVEGESYEDKMRRAELEREEQRVRREIERRQQEGTDEKGEPLQQVTAPDETPRGRQNWDEDEGPGRKGGDTEMLGIERGGEWDESKLKGKEAAEETKAVEAPKRKRSRWDETPAAATTGSAAAPGETPKRSRWDQTPAGVSGGIPKLGGGTSLAQFGMTPSASNQVQINTVQAGTSGEGFLLIGGIMDKRVRILSDEELDQMLPQEGYEIVTPPAGYAPIRTPARKLTETPMAANGGGFMMQAEGGISAEALGISQELPTDIEGVGDLQFFKQEDAQYFAKVCLDFHSLALSLIHSPIDISLADSH
jgi:splicing factor 3B subunit 1